MRLHTVRLTNFRNYRDNLVRVHGAKNVFLIGENGQGKTNFLEALYYISYASSFRQVKTDALASHGERGFALSAEFMEDGIATTLHSSYEKKNALCITTRR